MSKVFFFLILSFVQVAAFAQPVYTINDSDYQKTESYAVLPDLGYSLEKVLTDSTLQFIVGDSLRPSGADSYWIKTIVYNPSHYTGQYIVWLTPYMRNVLYYFDADAKKWIANESGLIAASNKQWELGDIPCILQAQTSNTLFLKVHIGALKHFGYSLKPVLYFEKRDTHDKRQSFTMLILVISLTVLLLFFLNNLYLYYNFRDKTILHYLVGQAGAILYILAYKHFFNSVFAGSVFTIDFNPKDGLQFYNWNALLMHASVVLILYGFIQFTRSYLNTAKTLPKFDKVLKYGLYCYMAASLILMLINTCFTYVDYYVLLYDNIFVLLLTLAILCTCVAGYVRKLPASGPFLLANMLPLVFMLAVGLSNIFLSYNSTRRSLLPDMAIISQAIIFSTLLVVRMKSILQQLATKEQEAMKLVLDIHEIEVRHNQIELDNQKITNEILHEKNRNELLQQKLEANQRELASTSLYIVQKNELLAGLNTQIRDLNKLYPNYKHHGLHEMESILQGNQFLDANWEKFTMHFEQVHPHFFENLRAKHPTLTKNEIRLHAYFHINLSTKEIAALLNIDPASVRQAKTRLNKKMAISEVANN